ncbi:AraC family transcriptional regulator [Ottowia sp.]|jgi:AraC-like DNA-binding protein|uniref:AraC family transcriptional regulator n=1 Tax=Ottowia sp. TaxID=1898956 RepID=UPI0025FA5B4B|nr:AraC family transcriptional regulator [Ottowia sp.]
MRRPPPDVEPCIHTPQRIAAVAAVLAEDGVAPAQTLAHSGLDASALRAPETRVSYRQIATVFRNALRLARDPAVALRAGAHMRLTAYGLYGYALLSSTTQAEAMEFAVKYNRAMGPVADITHVIEQGVESFRYDALLTPDSADPLHRFALEFTFSAHLSLSRDLFGPSFSFEEVRAAYPAPDHAPAYGQVLGCPVRFDQPFNELRIGAEWHQRQPRLPDAATHGMARELCGQFLAELPHSGGIASTVRRTLVEQMPWRFPRIDTMAQTLALEPRTLRRKLEAQGTSYREILAEVRRTLAIEYLRKTRMTTEEIASRLGYSDSANFRHAFVRWTGKAPHEYRRG